MFSREIISFSDMDFLRMFDFLMFVGDWNFVFDDFNVIILFMELVKKYFGDIDLL